MLYFSIGFISALILVAVATYCWKAYADYLTKTAAPTPAITHEPTDDQIKEFTEADQKATQDFLSSLAELNAFMTGKDFKEEIRNVGEQ